MYCSYSLQADRILSFFFFFNDTATTEIYTLSLHDALPISEHLSSAIFAYGSSTGLVSRLAAASRKWNGTNTWRGATRSEMRHELTMVLRRDVSRTRSPSSSASSRASSGWISTIGVGSRRSSPEARRVIVPVCQ